MKKLIFGLFLLIPSWGHSLTLVQIQDQVRLIIKDTDSSRVRYTDEQLTGIINEGQRDVVNTTWLTEQTTSFSLVAGTTFYGVNQNSNLIEVTRVTYDYKLLPETTISEQDALNEGGSWEKNSGVPQYYFRTLYNVDRIGIVPVPNSASTGTIRVNLIVMPPPLADGSITTPLGGVQWSTPYHDLLVFYTCYRIFLIEGENEKSKTWFQLYTDRLAVLKTKVNLRPNYLPGLSGRRR